MKKSFMSRILIIVFMYFAGFCLLVIIQFPNTGNFTLTIGGMTVKGSYLQSAAGNIAGGSQQVLYASSRTNTGSEVTSLEEDSEENNTEIINVSPWQNITGGIKLYYGGLEFNLMSVKDFEKSMILTGSDGKIWAINPESMSTDKNHARFGLPGGVTLDFNSLDSLNYFGLNINADFPEEISEVSIPIAPYRSSLIRGNDQLGIQYNNVRYYFTGSSNELENARLILSNTNAFVSYGSREEKQDSFNPANYTVARSGDNDYENAISAWVDLSYARWNQNASLLQNELEIAAFLAESLRRGSYTASVAAIPRDFISSSRHGYRSSGYLGGMTTAYRVFNAAEQDKINLITRLTRERSLDILKEEKVLDYLLIRNNTSLSNNVLESINNISPEQIALEHCPGILEIYNDIKRWRIPVINSAELLYESLIEQIILLVSENLYRDADNDLVYVHNDEHSGYVITPEYNLRLGKAIINWAELVRNTEWRAIGRSLVLSSLVNNSVGNGNLYNMVNTGNYYPKAMSLTDNGMWTWTVSSSVRVSNTGGNMNLEISFPQNMSHFLIIRGLPPFLRIQIHGQDWRTDSQFERYDSSGWVYYSQDQTLILKMRHRTTVESVRVFYRADE
ncbi:MAG: hypothetical protein FWC03_07980 [Treponema sp.]|nr:hypothetical protein [Treponema sp.]MCL2244391.1 hypothetical protein [Treponema sp.]